MCRRAGAVGVAAGLLLLGGCGIQESEVIGAGSPATVEAFGSRDRMLFFRAPDGGLNPVILTTVYGPEYVQGGLGGEDSGSTEDEPMPTGKLVMALLAGPREEDRAAGLSTALPRAHPRGTVRVEVAPDGKVTAGLPIDVGGLDRTALRQLICTIAHNQTDDGQVTVRLTGQDGVSRSGTCGLNPAAG
jgi:hypothetical protein